MSTLKKKETWHFKPVVDKRPYNTYDGEISFLPRMIRPRGACILQWKRIHEQAKLREKLMDEFGPDNYKKEDLV